MSRSLRQVAYEQPGYERPLREFIFFDFETTGLSPRTDRVIEIAALRVGQGGAVLGSFESLIRIDRHLPPFITKLTGISDKMLVNQRAASIVFPEFFEFIGNSVVVSYNIPFDMGFLRAEATRYTSQFIMRLCAPCRLRGGNCRSFAITNCRPSPGIVVASKHKITARSTIATWHLRHSSI